MPFVENAVKIRCIEKLKRINVIVKKRLKKQINDSGKGNIRFPCDKYPKAYALKHWQLGKSWLVPDIIQKMISYTE